MRSESPPYDLRVRATLCDTHVRHYLAVSDAPIYFQPQPKIGSTSRVELLADGLESPFTGDTMVDFEWIYDSDGAVTIHYHGPVSGFGKLDINPAGPIRWFWDDRVSRDDPVGLYRIRMVVKSPQRLYTCFETKRFEVQPG